MEEGKPLRWRTRRGQGWEPNRDDVADPIDYTRGALTLEDYQARSADKAARIAGAAA